jgi:hypothetical protein
MRIGSVSFPLRLVSLVALALALLVSGGSRLSAQTIATRLTSDRCMDIPGGSRNQGAQIALWSCHGGENQRFTVQSNGQIRTAGGLCINALGGGGRDGDKIGVWPCGGGANELWQLTGNGELKGINGKCIDVPSSNSSPGTGLVLWSCNGGLNQRWNLGATAPANSNASPGSRVGRAPAPTVKKLYVLDGTDSREVHHNAMYQVYEQWEGQKYWQNGVNLMATNIDEAYRQAYNTVCQDVRPASQGGGGVTEVYLAGYSRGAFMALKLANEARRNCRAEVRFLGLVDAVNSNIWNWPIRAEGGIPVAVHIRKMSGNEHVLTTRDLEGVTRILNPENIDHKGIVCNYKGSDTAWRWTRDQLIGYARQAGGVFGPVRRNSTDC